MRRFAALTFLGSALLLVGTAGTSPEWAKDRISGVGEVSHVDVGVAGTLLEAGLERSLEAPTTRRAGPEPMYEAFRARS
ncbi:MAG: hypothetical protein M8835_06195 [marine benthic group bacterium]|nr:hypothetical protein [Gemmatimonadota bacterium]